MKQVRKSLVLGLLLVAGMLQSVAWAGSTQDSYYIKRALEAIQSKDYETASYFLGQEVQENPTNGYAYAYLAALCDMMPGYNGPMFMFAKKAMPLLPKNEKYLKGSMDALQAQVYYAAGDTARALELWERAASYEPNKGRFLGHVAEVYSDKKDYQQLYELGDKMVNKIKGLNKEPLSYVVLVTALNGLKRYDEAIEYADKALKLKDLRKPHEGLFHENKAKALKAQKRYDEAIQEAMVATRFSVSRGARVLIQIADSSHMEVVLDSMEAAFEREPSEKIWPLAESDIYVRHNNNVQGVYQLLRGAKVGDDASAYAEAGQLVVHYLGDPEMGERLFRQALEKDSTSAQAWGSLADLYHDLGRYEEALKAIDQVLRLDPEQKEMRIPYTIRGRVYLSMHNYPSALEAYQRALVSENDHDAWPRMALLYRQSGDEAMAQNMIELGLLEMKKDTTMDMLLVMGDTLKAKEKAPKMVRNQTSANQQYNAACMYSRMNMPEEALAALRKSLENGFRNFHHFAWDDDIDNIRELPEYKAMMEEYRVKMKEEQAELKRLLEE